MHVYRLDSSFTMSAHSDELLMISNELDNGKMYQKYKEVVSGGAPILTGLAVLILGMLNISESFVEVVKVMLGTVCWMGIMFLPLLLLTDLLIRRNSEKIEKVLKDCGISEAIAIALNKKNHGAEELHILKTEESPTGYYGVFSNLEDRHMMYDNQFDIMNKVQVIVAKSAVNYLLFSDKDVTVGMTEDDIKGIFEAGECGRLHTLREVEK